MTLYLADMGYPPVRKCIHIEIDKRYSLIHEKDWTGEPYLLFARDTVLPERITTSGRRGTKRKG